MKFETLSELRSHIEQLSEKKKPGKEIWVCGGPGCVASGSVAVAEEFRKLIEKRASGSSGSFWKDLTVLIRHEDGHPKIRTGLTGCMGPCENGPIVHVEPEGWYYRKVTPEDTAGVRTRQSRCTAVTANHPKILGPRASRSFRDRKKWSLET